MCIRDRINIEYAFSMNKDNIVLVVCFFFLITSPIGQYVFSLAGFSMGSLIGELININSSTTTGFLMLGLGVFSFLGFVISKSNPLIYFHSFLFVFSICNLVLCLAEEINLFVIFYPDRFVVGTVLSFFILRAIVVKKAVNS